MIGSELNYLQREGNMISMSIEAHYDEYNRDFIFDIEVNEKNEIIMISYEGQDLESKEYEDADFEEAKSVILTWWETIEEFKESGKLIYS